MNRRTFLSLLPSIPLVPRLLGEEMIQLPPPIININGVDWGVQPYVDWREFILHEFPNGKAPLLVAQEIAEGINNES